MREVRLGALAVVLDRTDATAVRDPDDHRHQQVALRARVHLGHLRHDLVERRVDEAVELDLDDRPVATHRQPDRRAEDSALGQGGVDDAVLAEVLLQGVGDPEHAAQLADVLTEQDDLVVLLHVEGPRQGDRLGHDRTSAASKDAR